MILITIALFVLPYLIFKDVRSIDDLKDFTNTGYLGFFIANYFGFGYLLLPFLVTRLNPLILIAIGTLGSVLDEVIAWYAGYLSHDLDAKTALHRRVQAFVEKRGLFAIFALGLLPLPQIIYTASAFASGHYIIPLTRYFATNFLGKFVKTTVYAGGILYTIENIL